MILLSCLERGMDRLFLPIGLLYVADALKHQGKEVTLFHDHGTESNIERLVEQYRELRPDWVGFSSMAGPSLGPTIEASKRIKAEGGKVVWGGPFPSMVDVEEPYVDVAVKGEGEAWVSGRPVTNMDEYEPDWDIIDAERYGKSIYLTTSRGCTHRCGFCYSPVAWKSKWKGHSIQKVVKIFESYPLKPEEVEFRDDYFFVKWNRARKIVKALNVSWMSTIRPEDLTDEKVKMLDPLPYQLSFGIESSSQRLLDLMRKEITLECVSNALNVAEKYGIDLYLTFIVDLPTETSEEKQSTVEMARRLEKEYKNVKCSIKKFRAYPGTYLYELAVKEGFRVPVNAEEWADYAVRVWK